MYCQLCPQLFTALSDFYQMLRDVRAGGTGRRDLRFIGIAAFQIVSGAFLSFPFLSFPSIVRIAKCSRKKKEQPKGHRHTPRIRGKGSVTSFPPSVARRIASTGSVWRGPAVSVGLLSVRWTRAAIGRRVRRLLGRRLVAVLGVVASGPRRISSGRSVVPCRLTRARRRLTISTVGALRRRGTAGTTGRFLVLGIVRGVNGTEHELGALLRSSVHYPHGRDAIKILTQSSRVRCTGGLARDISSCSTSKSVT